MTTMLYVQRSHWPSPRTISVALPSWSSPANCLPTGIVRVRDWFRATEEGIAARRLILFENLEAFSILVQIGGDLTQSMGAVEPHIDWCISFRQP